MRFNTVLQENSQEIIDQLRQAWYPGTSSNAIRDSHIVDQAIRRFDGTAETLKEYIKEGALGSPKMLTIANASHQRLVERSEELSKVSGKMVSAAACLRAILEFTAAQLEHQKEPPAPPLSAPERRLLLEKVGVAERRLSEAAAALEEIKALLEEKEP